jgi:SAM-dependent methyltransferase
VAGPEDFELRSPEAPTWARWRSLRRAQGSLNRELMYERLRTTRLQTPLLDLGGGRTADYVQLLGAPALASVNIVPDLRPDVMCDANQPFPFTDGAFRSVVTLNTLEHLRDDRNAVSESFRVLQPGGELHIFVPFLYRVHGHPGDYRRRTAQGWAELVRECGGPDVEIVVEPLVWDPFATAWSIADAAPLGRWWWRARRAVRFVVLARPLLFGRVDRRLGDRAGATIAEYAVAYYIRGRRPGAES